MVHPTTKHGNDVTLEISLESNKAGKPLIPNHSDFSVVGNLVDGVKLKLEREGELSVNIEVVAS